MLYKMDKTSRTCSTKLQWQHNRKNEEMLHITLKKQEPMICMKAGEKFFFYWEKENRKIKLQNEDIRWNQGFLST